MKKKLRMIFDISMTILMPLLMAYSLVGETLHEVMGTAVFVLFILHHMLNSAYIKNVFKGKYHAARTANLVVNLLLFVIMFLLPISGILMSRYVFRWLYFGQSVVLARKVHMLLAHWGFVLMSVHIGFHASAMKSAMAMRKNNAVTAPVMWKRVCGIVLRCIVVVYGCYAFCKRQLAEYLFMQMEFAFYDFSEPFVFFLIDYAAIMVMCGIVGCHFMKFLKKRG